MSPGGLLSTGTGAACFTDGVGELDTEGDGVPAVPGVVGAVAELALLDVVVAGAADVPGDPEQAERTATRANPVAANGVRERFFPASEVSIPAGSNSHDERTMRANQPCRPCTAGQVASLPTT